MNPQCAAPPDYVRIDPGWLRASAIPNTLKRHGIEVQCFNLTSAPMEFENHPAIDQHTYGRFALVVWNADQVKGEKLLEL